MNLFHLHKWDKPVNRVQICDTCGMARTIPCAHQWVEYREINLVDSFFGDGKTPIGYKLILRCAHCGDLKSFDTRGKR